MLAVSLSLFTYVVRGTRTTRKAAQDDLARADQPPLLKSSVDPLKLARVEIFIDGFSDEKRYRLEFYQPSLTYAQESVHQRSDIRYVSERAAHEAAHNHLDQLAAGYDCLVEVDCPGFVDQDQQHWPCGTSSTQPLSDLELWTELKFDEDTDSWRHHGVVRFELGQTSDSRRIHNFGSTGHCLGWRTHRDMHFHAAAIGATIAKCDGYINRNGRLQPCPVFARSRRAVSYPLQCRIGIKTYKYSIDASVDLLTMGYSNQTSIEYRK